MKDTLQAKTTVSTKSAKSQKSEKTGKVGRDELKDFSIPVELQFKVTKKGMTTRDVAYAIHQHYCPANCVDLRSLASALKIKGGEISLIRLLQEAGLVNRGATPKDESLPKQIYLERNYFKVRRRMIPGDLGMFTFLVTKKGLYFVVNELRRIGVRVPEQIEKKLIFNLTTSDLRKRVEKEKKILDSF